MPAPYLRVLASHGGAIPPTRELIVALQLAAAMSVAHSGVDNPTFGAPRPVMAIGMGYVVQRRPTSSNVVQRRTAEAKQAGDANR